MEQERFVNETGAQVWPGNITRLERRVLGMGRKAQRGKQPERLRRHRVHMFPARLAFLLVFAALPWSLTAQSAPDPAASPAVMSNMLQPALSQVSQAISNIDIGHWKAPKSVKSGAAGDVSSIQRDLSGALAGLMSQAATAPSSIPSSFAVYRNVDALYDTLLRVVETADLSAPDQDATALESALKQLEAARTDLGERIMSATQAQQNEVVRLRTAVVRAVAAPQPVKTIVVDDGPVKKEKKEVHHRRTTKTTTKKPETSAAKPNPQ
jgi:hypothetical protein